MTEVRNRRSASLRVRLAGFSVITLVIALGGVGFALDAAYQRSAEEALRQQMDTWAYGIMAGMEVDNEGQVRLTVEPADPVLLQPGSGVYAQVAGPDSQWRSASLLGVAMPAVPDVASGDTLFEPPGENSAFYRRAFGVAWELADGSLQPLNVSVLVDRQRLVPQIRAFRSGLWRSLVAAAVVLVLAQLLLAALALRPLRQVAADVARVERGEAERLSGPYPRELEPLTRNVDRLLDTEQANRARYRNALDSLAHSLKTPLAVLRAALPATGSETSAQRQAVEDMQLLITTRLQRAAAGTRRTLGAPVAVAPVAERVAASLRKVHSQHLRNLEVKVPSELQFYGEERDLMELIGNLLENACKYGAGQVWLSAEVLGADAQRPGLVLRVENDGPFTDLSPFIPRGKRGDEMTEGHGLGLHIVSEVVTAYGGDLSYGPRGDSPRDSREADRGVSVVVTLPPNGVDQLG